MLPTDVAVIGGGPAGIAAATRAAEAGASVAIIDTGLRPGGQIWRHHDSGSLPRDAHRWITRLGNTRARWMLQTTIVDADMTRGLTAVGPDGTTRVIASRIVLATGARERFLPYPGWTLPGVMGVGGAQAMLKAGLDVRGKRVIIAGSGLLLLPVAAAMSAAGARLGAVVEQTTARHLATFALSLWSQPGKILLAGRYRIAMPLRGYRTGTWIERADGTDRVRTVTLRSGQHRWVEECDLLCCSYGLTPGVELARLLGCDIADGNVVVDEMQRTSVPGVFGAGEITGVAGDAAAIAEGEIAGVAASATRPSRISQGLRRRQAEGQRFAVRLRETFPLRSELASLANADTIVCRCEDVRLGELDPSWTGRQAKLYTRVGMGPCQGAVCGPALEHLYKWPPGSVRPPLFAPALDAWMTNEAERDPAPSSDGVT
jgi:NADPH-dependent 2,4-dienoyl-CoA reductase/sulfur reductase-like enzyme